MSAWQGDHRPSLLFPEATIYVGSQAWERANQPHNRDKASFATEINEQLKSSGRLRKVEKEDTLALDDLEIYFFQSNGHTRGMLCSDVRWEGNRIVFAADLVPGRHWVHLPVCMGYDRFPELVVEEKEQLLSSIESTDSRLFFTHDPEIAMARVEYDLRRRSFDPIDCHPDASREPTK